MQMAPPSLIAYMHEDVGESTDLLYEPSTSFDMCMDPSPHPNTAGTAAAVQTDGYGQGSDFPPPPRLCIMMTMSDHRRAACIWLMV